MKRHLYLIIFLFLPIILNAQTVDVFEKNIYYTAYEKPLGQVLVELSTRSKVNISFNPAIIPKDQLVSINIKNESLADVLDVILDGTNIEYEMLGGQIILTLNRLKSEEGKFILSGYVEDQSSGERLVYATVYADSAQVGTITNEYGFFSIETNTEGALLSFSYLGYQPLQQNVNFSEEKHIIRLIPEILLNEIVIIDTRLEKNKTIENVNTFPISALNSIPNIGGESDIMRLTAMQTGVSTGADGFGGLNVRGGSADQNLILLDGVPVYNTGHTLGMISIFNSSMIKSTQLLKDAFPSKYGGRLSSVLDIRTKEGNLYNYSGDISLGTLASKFTLEGPLKDGKSAFIISGRRSILDTWIKQGSRAFKNAEGNRGEVRYNFYDFNAKVHFNIGKNAKFYLSYYQGSDVFADETQVEKSQDSLQVLEDFQSAWNWGNRIASARLSGNVGDKLFYNTTLYYSKFSFEAFKNDQTSFEVERIPTKFIYDASLFQTNIADIGYRLDFDYNMNNRNRMQFGIDVVQHQFNPGLMIVNETDSLIELGEIFYPQVLRDSIDFASQLGYEANVYVEDNINVNKYLSLILGLRGSLIRSENENYFFALPRVIVNTKFNKNTLLKFSYSRMNQYLHLLTTSGLGLPTDIWLPTTDQLKPQQASQYSVSFLARIENFGHIEFGGFYKNLSRILTLREGPIFDINQTNDWEYEIPVGTGRNYGVETSLIKNVGSLKTMISYTWSKATRDFEEANNGNTYFFRYDRRHMFNMNASYQLNKNVEFTSTGSYLTGNPISVPSDVLSQGEDSERFLFVYPAKNNVRLKDYFRIDVAFNLYNTYDWGARQKLTIGVYNVTNELNPLFYYFRRVEGAVFRPERKQISILPLLPSISYSLAF